ncbi:MAG: FAD binding domain-containing protein [Anaerolineae bacterium]
MRKFEYFEPCTIEEAVALLAEHGDRAKVLAGGTDLLVAMKRREITPDFIVNIKAIPHMGFIKDEDGWLSIGALTAIRAVETSPLVREKAPVLAQAASQLASLQIRNLATLGGNLCRASPCAETAPALLGLGAEVRLNGTEGERVLPLEEFFTGPGQTALHRDEVMTEIRVPVSPSRTGGVYLKHGIRRMMDIAIVNVAVVVTLDGRSDVVGEIKIALGSVAPTPIRVRRAEELLRGQPVGEGLLDRAAQMASEEASPISDVRGSAQYRREMIKVMTRQAINQALVVANRQHN